MNHRDMMRAILVLTALVSTPALAGAQATITWAVDADGDWNVGSNWSGGVVPTVLDNVLIDRAAGDYTVTVSMGSQAAAQVVCAERLELTGGSLTVSGTVKVSNDFLIQGGRLNEATVLPGDGGEGLQLNSSGVLDDVTLEADAANLGGLSLQSVNGLIVNGTVSLGAYGTIIFNGTQSLSGSGEIRMSHSQAAIYPSSGGTLTIAAGITVAGIGSVGLSSMSGIYANEGLITADDPGGVLNMYGVGWTNTGTIRAEGGGNLDLFGSFTTSGLGTFEGTSGSVRIRGALDNSSDTLALSAATGSLQLYYGTITGGSIAGSGGASLLLGNFATLDGVVIESGVGFTNNSGGTTVLNGLTLNSTLDMGISCSLVFSGTQTLGGSGQINMDLVGNGVTPTNAGTLTIGSGITIRGKGSVGSVGAGLLVNEGLIVADLSLAELNLQGQPWINLGTMRAENGGILDLNDSFSTADLGDYQGITGTVRIHGSMDNSGATFAPSAATGSPVLYMGTITGGTLSGSGGAGLLLGYAATLDGVVIDAGVGFTGSVATTVLNGLTLNTTLDMGTFCSLTFNGGLQTLDGTGQVNMANGSSLLPSNAGTLTLGSDITIRGRGTIGSAAAGWLINEGLIVADVSAAELNLQGQPWINLGTMRAENGGILDLNDSFSTADLGDYEGITGTVRIHGSMDNSGATFAPSAATGSPQLYNGTIAGGTLSGSGGATLLLSTGSTLDGVTIDAGVNFAGSYVTTQVANGLTLNTSLDIGPNCRLEFISTQTLGGTGQINMDETSCGVYPAYVAPYGTLTVASGITIRGKGSIGLLSFANWLLNEGLILADLPGAALYLSGTHWVNLGTMRAENGAILSLRGSISTGDLGSWEGITGTVRIEATLDNTGTTLAPTAATGSPVLYSPGKIVGGTLSGSGGAGLLLGVGSTLDGVVIDGGVGFAASTITTTVLNGLTLNSTLDMGPACRFNFNGGLQTLGGTGQLDMDEAGCYLYPSNSGTLTIGGDMTVRGRGIIGDTGPTKVTLNEGTIIADLPGTILTAHLHGNSGTLQVAGSATLNCKYALSSSGTILVGADGLLDCDDSVTLDGGLARIDGGGTMTLVSPIDLQGGTLAGSGEVIGGIANAAGTVSPGASAGELTGTGSYAQGGTGSLAIELGGAAPGEYDVLVLTGATTLDGTLDVTLIDPFLPIAGQSFTIIEHGARTGSFATVNYPVVAGIDWNIDYGPSSVTLNTLAAGAGDAVLAPDPVLSGPINCSESVNLEFLYTPPTSGQGLRGYSVRIQAESGLSFSDGDIAVYAVPTGANFHHEIINHGTNDYTVDYTILGANPGTTTPATLFSINFHGAATDSVSVSIAAAVLHDDDNLPLAVDYGGTAGVLVDCSPPVAVAEITAVPGHNRVDLNWSHDGTDAAVYEIYRGLWYDSTPGASAYPEFDDLPGATVPARPGNRAAAAASAEWELAGTVAAGVLTFTDTWPDDTSRGIYFYEVFTGDAVENFSPGAQSNDQATNYWLGDVDALHDGAVDLADITNLGAVYGLHDGDPYYDNEIDIGPTDDFSGLGIPDTDNVINFEDLMIFGLNYGIVGRSEEGPAATPCVLQLAWNRLDTQTWVLELVEPCAVFKGLRLNCALPGGMTPVVAPGALLDAQSVPIFLRNIDENGIDLGLIALGRGATITGSGELLRVVLPEGTEIGLPVVTARDFANAPLDLDLDTVTSAAELPVAFTLARNFPNPFNPNTTISFEMPSPARVRLSVYSMDGRCLRSLVDRELPAGRHEAVWRGRDDAGVTQPSGLYFYRLEAGDFRATEKMLLLK